MNRLSAMYPAECERGKDEREKYTWIRLCWRDVLVSFKVSSKEKIKVIIYWNISKQICT